MAKNNKKVSTEKTSKKNKKNKVSKDVVKAEAQTKAVVSTESSKKEAPSKVQAKADKVTIFSSLLDICAVRPHPFQLVRHFDEVTVEANRNYYPYRCEVKYDGNLVGILVEKGEVIGSFSRTGNKFNNLKVIEGLFSSAKKDGVYIGEVYVDKSILSLEKLSGSISPFRKAKLTAPMTKILDEDVKIAIFDYVCIDDFIAGKAEIALEHRIETLEKLAKKVVKKSKGRVHFPEATLVDNEKGMLKYFNDMVEKDHEGIVIKSLKHPYVAGHKNFHFTKMVKGISHDLECIGCEIGADDTKRKGQVTNLIFKYKDGLEVKANLGKGYTDEDRTAMAKAFAKGKKKKTPIGKVFAVIALEESSKGILRLPRVSELRHDKKADY